MVVVEVVVSNVIVDVAVVVVVVPGIAVVVVVVSGIDIVVVVVVGSVNWYTFKSLPMISKYFLSKGNPGNEL